MNTITINNITFTQVSSSTYRVTLNIPLGVKYGELYVLESLFINASDDKKSSNFHGATFSVFEKCNDSIIKERRKNAEEEYDYIWSDAVQSKQTTASLAEWCEGLEDEFFYDSSYRNEAWYNAIVEKMKSIKGWEDTEFFNCVGGGRQYQEGMESPDFWDISFIHEVSPDILKTMQELETQDTIIL